MTRSLLTLSLLLPALSQAVDYKKDIRPIIRDNCYECHSEESGKQKAGYSFDDPEIFKLDIQPKGIIVPGDPGDSYFLEVLTMPESEKAHMPPKETLPTEDIRKIAEWIKAGASLETMAASNLPAREAEPVMEEWTNNAGVTIKAALLRVEGDQVIFKLATSPDEVPYPIANLSPESQAKAREAAEE